MQLFFNSQFFFSALESKWQYSHKFVSELIVRVRVVLFSHFSVIILMGISVATGKDFFSYVLFHVVSFEGHWTAADWNMGGWVVQGVVVLLVVVSLDKKLYSTLSLSVQLYNFYIGISGPGNPNKCWGEGGGGGERVAL